MNGRPILTDAFVEQMLARRVAAAAPAGLIDTIAATVAETPQVRRHWWQRVPAPAPRSPALRIALILAAIGLLLATALAAVLVGSQLLRQHDERSVVVPVPSEAPSPGPTFAATASAFGPITWSTIDVPGNGIWWPLVGTPHGPLAAVDSGVDGVDDLRWLGPDGSWLRLALPGEAFRLHAVGDSAIVAPVGDAPSYWLRFSGSGWVVGEPVDVEGPMDANDVVSGPRGSLLTDGTDIAYSIDGSHFVRAVEPPDKAELRPSAADCGLFRGSSEGVGEGHVGPILATERGFVALTAADPADWVIDPTCEPVIWFSSDGSTWELVSTSTPFGPGAHVSEVASRAGRHVAIGAVPPSEGDPGNAVWVSDDGLAWQRVSMPDPAAPCPLAEPRVCGHVFSRVVAGDAGWIILDHEGFAWTSLDGRSWEAVDGWPGIPGGWMPQGLALSPGSIVETSAGEVVVFGTFGP